LVMIDNNISSLSAEALSIGRRIKGLRDFLEILKENDQLVSWPNSAMPEPDIRNISAASARDVMNGPAVMIDQIVGYPGKRIVIGVHGSFTNLALLLGFPKGTTIKELFFEVVDRWKGGKALIDRVAPDDALVHSNRVEENINLYDLLPLYRINEYDGGFYIDKANVVSRDPTDPDNFDKQNVGIYRIQAHGPDMFSLDAVPSHDMGQHIRLAEASGKKLKIAVMIGNHPAMAMFAATPLNYNESEFAYASQMMGAPLELTESGNGLDILANTEIVIEAEMVNNERIFEGPFGEFPGTYSGVRKLNVFKVTAVSHRDDPIFESLYIGSKSWSEHDTLLGINTCAPVYNQLKQSFPEVVAVNALYQHGLTAVISVKNRFAGFAKSVAMRALSTPHGLMYLKNLIMVDSDIDPFDLNQVMWSLSTRTRAEDIVVLPNMPLSDADPSAVVGGKRHRLIIDATGFLPPDEISINNNLVESPRGTEVDEIAKLIAELQLKR
jgi:vanillate/4-hydroxybenzoate decarboxylase subunit C